MKQYTWSLILFGIMFFVPLGAISASEDTGSKVSIEIGDDGLYKQSWFMDGLLYLNDDLVEAQEAGKRFAVMWEQRGCPYCKETHTKNLSIEPINRYISNNFVIVQLNLWGDRQVTDFDGEKLSEKELARKWGVVFTPTIHFFVEQHELKEGKPGDKQLASIMPGYFRPFHFISMFEFVRKRRYEQQHFQKYIAEKVQTYRAAGKSLDHF